jgi:UDP-glucuronate 4-epimerase
MNKRTILVTGVAGFIGSHVAEALLKRGDVVVGLDNFNDYYSPATKRSNLAEITGTTSHSQRFFFIEGDVRNRNLLCRLYLEYQFNGIIHLAAMAGVRASVYNPSLYYDVNLNGTLALLEAVTSLATLSKASSELPVFVFATTSSAYGATHQIPFLETDACNEPLAPYAASKRAAELLGYTYYHLYHLNFTALRFFTVYGPRNRPDMMAYKIMDNIFSRREVPLYNQGQMYRDWTYVDDIVRGIMAAVDRPLGYQIINLGRGAPVLLADFVHLLEELTGRPARLTPAPAPDTDVPYTYADIGKANKLLGYHPTISVEEGVRGLWHWYQKAVLTKEVASR